MVTAAIPGNQFRHLALLYHGHGEYLSVLRTFIQACAARGDAVFIAVPRRKTLLVRRELADASAYMTLADMAELGRNPARIIPAVLSYASQHRGQNVCFIGEPIWPGRTAAEIEEATRHEALINLAFRDSPVTVLCPYNGVRLPKWSWLTRPARIRPSSGTARRQRASVTEGRPTFRRDVTGRCPRRPPTLRRWPTATTCTRCAASSPAGPSVPGSPPRIPNLVLAIGELAANTLRHTSGGGTVQFWRTGDRIVCQVSDTGQITDPLARHRVPPDEELGGKGLWLVNQVCDLVQARTGRMGTITRLHMRTAPARG